MPIRESVYTLKTLSAWVVAQNVVTCHAQHRIEDPSNHLLLLSPFDVIRMFNIMLWFKESMTN